MATLDYELVDVVFDGEQPTYTYIAVNSQQAAEINGLTGDVRLVPIASLPDQNVVIIPKPEVATPIANDDLVYVSGGPIVKAPSGSITPPNPPGTIMKVPDAGTLSTTPPTATIGALLGLANKEGGMMAKIIAKLGRAGKLLGPIAGWAAAILTALSVLQSLTGSPEKDKNKAGQYNGQKDPIPAPGTTQIQPTTPGGGGIVNSGSIGQDVLMLLETRNAIGLTLDARCGKLSSLAPCLCDPSVRRAAKLLDMRFSETDRNMIFNEICGCAVSKPATPVLPQPTNYQMPTNVIPAVYPGTSTQPTQPTQPTGPQCYPKNAPPVGTYPAGWKPPTQA